jgi:hypothetical protein
MSCERELCDRCDKHCIACLCNIEYRQQLYEKNLAELNHLPFQKLCKEFLESLEFHDIDK